MNNAFLQIHRRKCERKTIGYLMLLLNDINWAAALSFFLLPVVASVRPPPLPWMTGRIQYSTPVQRLTPVMSSTGAGAASASVATNNG
ncbi:hypothetical protein M0R45_022914 [Rubus argutus]|uniref:Uncharacterized protein n=1 Tax=Rubus argutus TaxID=59490 RepID=A0AAW1WM13_RUBAR